jgi:hypothetical protein
LRATPAFLFHAGVIISIAVTFVPQMVLGAKEIRQAQRIRGHRFRGIRDLLPLILPLLARAQRAIQLAETMEARLWKRRGPISGRRALLGPVSGGAAGAAGRAVNCGLPARRACGAGPWRRWAGRPGGDAAVQGQQVHCTATGGTRWRARSAVAVASAVALRRLPLTVLAASFFVPPAAAAALSRGGQPALCWLPRAAGLGARPMHDSGAGCALRCWRQRPRRGCWRMWQSIRCA